MSNKKNQERERYYFEMFRKHYSVPIGNINYGDKPDVILGGERQIGIEITNLFLEKGKLSESEQVQRLAREKVVSEAQRIFHTRNGKKIELTFGFDKANPIQDQKELIEKIAVFAKHVEGCETGQISNDIFHEIPQLSVVYLNAKEYKDAEWRIVQVYDVLIMSRNRIIDIVRNKEVRAKNYKKCDALWLLVIVDSTDRAQDQEIQINGFKKIQTEVFEKVIIYRFPFGHRHILEAK
jgi:hypothetical protein